MKTGQPWVIRSGDPRGSLALSTGVALCVAFWLAARAGLAAGADPPAGSSAQLDEVTVRALRWLDERTLDRVVIPKFVASHGIASARINQVGSWHDRICPETQGLQPLSNEYVSRRVLELAGDVGAPTERAGRCKTNVEILFTAHPEEQLSYVVKNKPGLLGYSPSGLGELTTFDHPIQAWYATRTHSFVAIEAPTSGQRAGHEIVDDPMARNLWITTDTHAQNPPMGQSTQDSTGDLVRGVAGSRLENGMTSEFVNVLILIDSRQVNEHPLRAIADYVAMLMLTRSALGGCNELPSVIDLLSRDCGERPPPPGITSSDEAYLKALYASNLEMNVSLERGEIHDRMLRHIVGH
jgi:hypothetical protein